MIRIDRADRDHTELLNPANWFSSRWGGDSLRGCRGCADCDPEHAEEQLWTCEGTGQVEDTRYGVSVCADEDDLVEYLAQVGGADLGNAVLVELNGTCSDDEALDAHLGEELLLPTEIVSVTELGDGLRGRILARLEDIEGN